MDESLNMRPDRKDNSLERQYVSITLLLQRLLFSLHSSHVVSEIGISFISLQLSKFFLWHLPLFFVSLLTINRDPESIVTLYAATDETRKPPKIHKDVVCHYSPVLKAAFESQFHEGQTQSYTFQDVSQNLIKLLIHVSAYYQVRYGETLPYP